MYKILKDIVIFPEKKNKWVIMNIFSKTSIGVNSEFFEFFGDLENTSIEIIQEKFSKQKFVIWQIEKFSNEKGLLEDPSRYIRNIDKWPQGKKMGINEIIENLKKNFLIIENEEKYRRRFKRKKSVLDYENFGNFHDQLGQYLLLKLRKSPEKWWIQQKFSNDLKSVRNNLYKAIQTKYLEKYFQTKFHEGDKVIDMGCGVGFYSNMIAKSGALVTGIDPNQEYIKLAKENAIKGTNFENFDIGNPGALEKIPTQYADYVFMSDALLFYFVSPNSKKKLDLKTLFSDIKRILKPDGIFINVEPHYIFWLLPWLGELETPFTVLTEYNHKNFGVTATLSQLIQAYSRGGFVVSWMEELIPDPYFESIDLRAYHFAKEFPLWHLFELMPIKEKKNE